MKEQRFEKVVEVKPLEITYSQVIILLILGIIQGYFYPMWANLLMLLLTMLFVRLLYLLNRKVYWRKI